MVFRLGCVVPSLTDGTSFYRAAGPLQALERSMNGDLRLEFGGTINWVYLRGIDALFMQRPFNNDHLRVAGFCAMQGKPLWVDYDDDLYAVPMQNPTHKMYGQKSVHNNITQILARADVVTVSTEALREKFARILERIVTSGDVDYPDRQRSIDKIIVLPNGYDAELFGYSFRRWREPVEVSNPLALWRGSHTHDADLSAYTMAISQAFTTSGTGWTMNFVGSPFWGTIQHLTEVGIANERVVITPPLDPIEYFHFLAAVKPSFVFTPLIDDSFNRAKSNIAWIEAAHAGAVCLGPKWSEWQRPGVVHYENPQSFMEAMQALLKGKIDTRSLVAESRRYIAENLTLEKLNRTRASIIERLASIDPWSS